MSYHHAARSADPRHVVGGAPSRSMTAKAGQHLNCSDHFAVNPKGGARGVATTRGIGYLHLGHPASE